MPTTIATLIVGFVLPCASASKLRQTCPARNCKQHRVAALQLWQSRSMSHNTMYRHTRLSGQAWGAHDATYATARIASCAQTPQPAVECCSHRSMQAHMSARTLSLNACCGCCIMLFCRQGRVLPFRGVWAAWIQSCMQASCKPSMHSTFAAATASATPRTARARADICLHAKAFHATHSAAPVCTASATMVWCRP